MTQPSAKVIADSISPSGHRLTTLEVVMHRFVLAEFNTHRLFSRNSASSRAIPVKKQLERVIKDPAIPLSWPKEQKGMQGGNELEGEEREKAIASWLFARDAAARYVRSMSERGVHKSVVNRLLEPFMWHTVIVSSTDFSNFFAQRCSPLAQPEIRVAAEAMRAALEDSKPTLVDYGEWHTPYIQPDEAYLQQAVKNEVSAARCARVSYLTHDGRRDISEDEKLYVRLVTANPAHASPLEHVATPVADEIVLGNFQGWQQLRHLVLAA